MSIHKAWDTLTVEDFDVRTKSLASYKAKTVKESWDQMFEYSNSVFHHTPEEKVVIINNIRNNHKFEDYQVWLAAEVQKVKDELLAKKDAKLIELKDLAEKAKIDTQVAIDAEIEKQKTTKANQEALLKKQADAELERQKESDDKLNALILDVKIESQAESQNVKGLTSGVKNTQAVKTVGDVDWNLVISHYEDKSDLDFLLKNLIKAGKPVIPGVVYYIEKTSSNK